MTNEKMGVTVQKIKFNNSTLLFSYKLIASYILQSIVCIQIIMKPKIPHQPSMWCQG
uniref:Uncharacterized protein n=1 Tax=Arion vulgaris TaxID=1028688 RepID=A0A0B7AH10_9EUPU